MHLTKKKKKSEHSIRIPYLCTTVATAIITTSAESTITPTNHAGKPLLSSSRYAYAPGKNKNKKKRYRQLVKELNTVASKIFRPIKLRLQRILHVFIKGFCGDLCPCSVLDLQGLISNYL